MRERCSSASISDLCGSASLLGLQRLPCERHSSAQAASRTQQQWLVICSKKGLHCCVGSESGLTGDLESRRVFWQGTCSPALRTFGSGSRVVCRCNWERLLGPLWL